jgi:hypothetical protein
MPVIELDVNALPAIVVGFVLAYYVVAWLLVGRGPRLDSVVVTYEPPNGLSPAALRYLWKMECDFRVCTAGILNLAKKGYLSITALEDGISLQLAKDDWDPLAPDENELLTGLFEDGRRSVTVRHQKDGNFEQFRGRLARTLDAWLRPTLFEQNRPFLLLGIGLSVLGFYFMQTRPDVDKGVATASVYALLGINVIFFWLLKRPSAKGQALRAQILGYREYLKRVDRDSSAQDELAAYLYAFELPQPWADGVDIALNGPLAPFASAAIIR